MKTCTKCKEERSYEEFHKSSSHKTGYKSVCKSCAKLINQIRYENRKDHILQVGKAYRDANPEKERARHQTEKSKLSRHVYRMTHAVELSISKKRYYESRVVVVIVSGVTYDMGVKEIAKVATARRYRSDPESSYKQHRNWILRNPEKNTAYKSKYSKGNPSKVLAIKAKRRAFELQSIAPWINLEKVKEVYLRSSVLNKESSITYEVDHIVPLVSKLVCGLHWEGNLQIIPASENRKKSNIYWPGHPDENYDKLVP